MMVNITPEEYTTPYYIANLMLIFKLLKNVN